MPNYENFFQYDYWQYEVIRHVFSLTAAVFAASLVYFAMTAKSVLPRFRNSNYISAVVMVSATLELFALWLLWNQAFERVDATGTYALVEGQIFSNGYRYANWLIDVPMLLTQFLVILGFAGAAFFARWWRLAFAGVAMIITGYIGQYYEPQVAGLVPSEDGGLGFWVWGGISWLVFFALLWEANKAYQAGRTTLSDPARKEIDIAWKILLVTWFIYGFAYLVPGIGFLDINQSPDWVVVRQILYTVADIVSKTVFGIMLTRAAMKQSAFEDPRFRYGEPDMVAAQPGTPEGAAQPTEAGAVEIEVRQAP